MTTARQPMDIKHALKDSIVAALVALAIFAPLVGILLDGYEFQTRPRPVLFMVMVVFVGRFLAGLAWQRGWWGRSAGITNGTPDGGILARFRGKHLIWAVSLIGLVVGLAIPFLANKYWLSVFILALIYVLLGLGLNIVVGLAGLLDLGFVAFYAVGAYGYALSAQYWDLTFWQALPLCALMAAGFGAVLGFPVLRMHGDYLAIVTLGFGEIISLILNNWIEFTGGPSGATAPLPTLFGLEFKRTAKQGGVPFHEFFNIEYSPEYFYMFLYLCLLVAAIFMTFFINRLKTMPIGRAWEALREDEIACRSLGINHVVVKLSAFAMGAMVGGIAGVFYAGFQQFINPTSFTFFESALILAVVVLGGMGSTLGVVLAAIVLTVLPEFLREFSDFRILIFGIAMVLMMIWRPRGLVKSRRRVFDLPVIKELG